MTPKNTMSLRAGGCVVRPSNTVLRELRESHPRAMELGLTRNWESSAPGPLLASDFSLQIKDCLVHQMGAGLANTVQKNKRSCSISTPAIGLRSR